MTVASFIYFVHCPRRGLVKIGVTRDVEHRCVSIRHELRAPIRCLFVMRGTWADEQRLHNRLRAHRVIGREWYEAGAIITELQAGSLWDDDWRSAPAAVRLLRQSGWTQAGIARILRVSPQSVGQWFRDGVRPNHRQIKRMRDQLGIPVQAWFEPARKAG